MNDTASATANTSSVASDTTVQTAPAATPKKTRKPDPSSKVSRVRAFLATLPADQLVHKTIIPRLMQEFDISLGVANVYYYNTRPKAAV